MNKRTQEPKERKVLPFIVTKIDEPQGIVDHTVAVFGNVDLGGDRIWSGAFTKTINERMGKIRVLDSHNTDSIMRVIGKPLAMAEVGRGALDHKVLEAYPDATGALMATTQFLMDTPEGSGAFKRIVSGAVNEYSIGYDPIDVDYTEEEVDGHKAVVRELRTIKLWEYSPVIFAMNDATSTVSAKANGEPDAEDDKQDGPYLCECLECGHEMESAEHCQDVQCPECGGEMRRAGRPGPGKADEDKGANGAANLPIADRDRAWDAGAAIAGMRRLTGSEEEPSAGYKRGFFWHDGEETDNFGAYKLPFADAEGDALTAVPKGIFSAAAAIQGARGGVDIPSEDMAQVRNRISNYYRRMRSEFDDDGIVPPWEKAVPVAFVTKQNLMEHVNNIVMAFYSAYPDDMDQAWWVEEVHDTHCIVQRVSVVGNAYYRVGYSVADGAVAFQPQDEWMEVEYVWVPKEAEDVEETQEALDILEEKVGRVLAQRNANRIAAALTSLVEVLEDAGIDLGGDDEEPEEEDEKQAGALPAEEAALDREANDEPEDAGPADQPPTSEVDKGALLEQIQASLLDIDRQMEE